MLQYNREIHIWNGSRDIQMGNIGLMVGRSSRLDWWLHTFAAITLSLLTHEAFCIGPYGVVKLLSR